MAAFQLRSTARSLERMAGTRALSIFRVDDLSDWTAACADGITALTGIRLAGRSCRSSGLTRTSWSATRRGELKTEPQDDDRTQTPNCPFYREFVWASDVWTGLGPHARTGATPDLAEEKHVRKHLCDRSLKSPSMFHSYSLFRVFPIGR